MVERREHAGRPKSDINWDRVDELLMAGCPGTHIAMHLGIAPETLYRRCLEENNINFEGYSRDKKKSGDDLLREHQYRKALGLTDKGDNTLLIWLGKQRLEQRENPSMKTWTPEDEAKLDMFTKWVQERQSERKIEDNSAI